MRVKKKIEKGLEIDVEKIEGRIIKFIQEKTEEANAEGAVIGLSGGLDSSTIAYLAKEALGQKNVLGIFIPEKGVTEKRDFEDVEKVTKNSGIDSKTIPIDDPLQELKKKVGANDEERMGLANMKARMRMTILYYYANTSNSLVIGSSNKSELQCGYFTKFGDGASDIVPMSQLYKSQEKKIAKDLGIPKSIIEKPPTAGLWKNQSDEKELGLPYEKIDKIYRGLELGFEKKEIAEALDLNISDIEKFKQMKKKSGHKRKGPTHLDLNLD